ncbi:hypothetical protein EDC04DRAFT_2913403 [Pisolithus marmoratus]|nr:hypothetical protein EDC04DRAFT_2913403 [Pisolithus marmoratus]
MDSSVNSLSLPSIFNPSLLPQDSNQQDVSYSLNTGTTVAPELLGEIDNTLLLNLEESQYNSDFDDLLQDNAS